LRTATDWKKRTSLYEIETPAVLFDSNVVTPTGCGGKEVACVTAAVSRPKAEKNFILKKLNLDVRKLRSNHDRDMKH
jgi:hypothetical protein